MAAALDVPVHVAAAVQLVYESYCYSDYMVGNGGGGGGSGGPRGNNLGCTSIAVDTASGCPVHARTLDWLMPGVTAAQLLELTVDLVFVKAGEELYRATSLVCFLGLLTGVRKDGYSLSINFRKDLPGGFCDDGTPTLLTGGAAGVVGGMLGLAGRIVTGGWAVSFLTRHLIESCATYDEAVQSLIGRSGGSGDGGCAATVDGLTVGNHKLLAPCYIMLVGTKNSQGVLLTCSSGTTVHASYLSTSGYLVQSNCDSYAGSAELPSRHELSERVTSCIAKDFCQGESLLRRDVGLKLVKRVASGSCSVDVVKKMLGEALRTCPVGNEATVHESVMCAGSSRAPNLESRGSPWPEKLSGGSPSACCDKRCNRPTWFDEMASAALVPGRAIRLVERCAEEVAGISQEAQRMLDELSGCCVVLNDERSEWIFDDGTGAAPLKVAANLEADIELLHRSVSPSVILQEDGWILCERTELAGPNAGERLAWDERLEKGEEVVLAEVPEKCMDGSLEMRRGAWYYCEAHCLRVAECSVREMADTQVAGKKRAEAGEKEGNKAKRFAKYKF
jgi:hypothetical protein